MASVASQLLEEVTAHAQSDSLEDAREICADGTYFLNNLSKLIKSNFLFLKVSQSYNNLNNFNKCNKLRNKPIGLNILIENKLMIK